MHRKGVSTKTWFTIIELTLLFFIYVSLSGYVNSHIDNSLLEKNYLARDLALTIDTIHAAPGNTQISYPFHINDFLFDVYLEKNKVSIRQEKDLPIEYSFFTAKQLEVPEAAISTQQNRITLAKTNDKIVFDQPANLRLVSNAEQINVDKIVIYTINNESEKIVTEIQKQLDIDTIKKTENRDNDILSIAAKNPELLLIINLQKDYGVEKNEIQVNTVKGTKQQEAKKVARAINNKFKDGNFETYSIAEVGQQSTTITAENAMNIYLKITVQSITDEERKKIAQTITEGLMNE